MNEELCSHSIPFGQATIVRFEQVMQFFHKSQRQKPISLYVITFFFYITIILKKRVFVKISKIFKLYKFYNN